MNDFKKIKEEIINQDPDLLGFFNDIDKKRGNREWYIEREPLEADFLGQTIVQDNYINITLKTDEIKESLEKGQEYKEKEKAVLIHELGEVDYQLSGLPFFTETFEDISDEAKNLNEVLSHYHIKCILSKLKKIETLVYSNLTCKEKTNNENEDWKKIIRTCWLLSTYPDLNLDDIEYKYGYSKNVEKEVNSIINKIKSMDTLNLDADNIKLIKDTKEQIIEILKRNGMTDDMR